MALNLETMAYSSSDRQSWAESLRSLSTERLLELTKTETNKDFQKAIIQELVTRATATVITPSDDEHSLRRKVMAVTPENSIPQEWLD